MGDMHILHRLKGKVFFSYVTLACVYGPETTEKQEKKEQVCENNWVRRIVGTERVEQRRKAELKVEVGAKKQERLGKRGTGMENKSKRKRTWRLLI